MIHRIAKHFGITETQAAHLIRAPEGSHIKWMPGMLHGHDFAEATRADPKWSSTVSIEHPTESIHFHDGGGEPGTNNSLHTVRSLIAARDMGLKVAHIHTALGSRAGNGAYTYPRLGFEGTLPAKHQAYALIKRAPATAVHATRLSQLMLTPQGQSWWKSHHYHLTNLHFDLTPGSEHWGRLEKYLHERAAAGRETVR